MQINYEHYFEKSVHASMVKKPEGGYILSNVKLKALVLHLYILSFGEIIKL